MPTLRLLTVCLFALSISAARAADPPHPLRLVPEQNNLIVRIEQPRKFVETFTQTPLLEEARGLPFVREQLASPVVQRFLNLVAYYEQDLGIPWPELLDKLAGRGLTLAAKAGADNKPAKAGADNKPVQADEDNNPLLLIVHGNDEELTKRFLKLVVSVVEQELIREESKDKVKKGNYKGIEGWRIGKDLLATQLGPDLVFSNNKEAMQAAVDRHLDPKLKNLAQLKGPNEARKALPADSLAWLWLDLDVARKAPNAKELFAQPSNDVVQTVAIGGWVDVVRRAPFLAVALHREQNALKLTLRFPGGGYDGSPEQLALHRPPKDQPGVPPLLEPKNVILSQGFWFDFKALWEQRGKLFNEKIAKDFEEGVKKASPFLPGTSLEKLFVQSGPYHRFVAVNQEGDRGYKIKPGQYIPAFAAVTSMRDPKFAKSMDAVLRGAALLAGAQAKLKLVEETHAGVKLVGYRFPEGEKFPNDPENLRFNFTPCFGSVGNQFFAASTIELGREMVEILQKEFESSSARSAPSPLRIRLYSNGGSELLKAVEDQVLGQIILDQAVKPAEAKKQLDQLMSWARRLGSLELHSEFHKSEYRFDIDWRMGK